MKRIYALEVLLIGYMFVILINLFNIQVLKESYYENKVREMTETKVYSSTAPRGRIYDRNGILLVDNKPVKVIYYLKEVGVSTKEELKIADKLSKILEVDYSKITTNMLKEYYLKVNSNLDLITDEEYKKYKDRKLSKDDLHNLKLERIKEDDINSLNKETAYIYYLMNNGYSYTEKIIKDENVSNEEYAIIAENVGILKGVNIRLDWERVYPYGITLRGILGNVGKITDEYKDYYISNGYKINDRVGISYLEYEYDKYLKGEKNEYIRSSDGTYKLVKEGKKGNDIYLNIDIKLQEEIENIIVNNIKRAKYEPNTNFLNRTYVILTDVKTGGIIALAGKKVINNSVYDISTENINMSYTVGSVVKGASHIVGYNTNALKIGEVRNDECIKIKGTPKKCSFMYLGYLNDLTALKRSSNTFQFHTAIKVGGSSYFYNMGLTIKDSAFNLYRDTFKEFGLGVKTEIDLPNEMLGLIGTKKDAGLLLDYSIGQYDTYTPIQLSQYITTIANNGVRIKPYILDKVVNNRGEVIYDSRRLELNKVTTEEKYLNRIKEGFKMVLEYGGTGSGYINLNYKPAGKTGTSQTFIDTNNDGLIDKETISTTFVGYFPYDDPKISITVISPDVSTYTNTEYISFITKRIVTEVADAYFKRY
ncbi:MAG: penicillin-binding protein 2 [Bacilli bacterium]|nr:penicillin-binding protein 2 [Bacilli bacterium]